MNKALVLIYWGFVFCNSFSILRKFKTKIMAKRKRKSNFEDTSFKGTPELDDLIDLQQAIDPMQIDIEDQIEEEEAIVEEKEYKTKATKFKNPMMEITIPGTHTPINNDNITEGDIDYLINHNICSASDFN